MPSSSKETRWRKELQHHMIADNQSDRTFGGGTEGRIHKRTNKMADKRDKKSASIISPSTVGRMPTGWGQQRNQKDTFRGRNQRQETELLGNEQTYMSKFYEARVQTVVEHNKNIFEALETLRNNDISTMLHITLLQKHLSKDLLILTNQLFCNGSNRSGCYKY